MIDRFALSCVCIELDRNVRFGVMLLYILLVLHVQEAIVHCCFFGHARREQLGLCI